MRLLKNVTVSACLFAAGTGLGVAQQGDLPLRENAPQVSGEVRWEKIGPGGGGATFIPTFSYHSASDFLLKCDMTGSYHSRDGGKSYDQINLLDGAGCFAYDPHDSNTVYIGSAVLNRSRDGGRTWEQLFPGKKDMLGASFSGDHAGYRPVTRPGSSYEKNGRIGTIKVDPARASSMYFSMGEFLFSTGDGGKSWQEKEIGGPIEFLYTNMAGLKAQLVIFTPDAAFTLDKRTGKLSKNAYPEQMSPAFSFTAGIDPVRGKEVFYALHHDTSREIREEFGYSEVWVSEDRGRTWSVRRNPVLANTRAGVKPSYSMIACSEADARQVYLVTNRYEEKKGKKSVYWYGAMKSGDSGKSWDWVWKGGGGSGQYGVKDGVGVANLEDAWAEEAFGGEYIRLMDIGVSPVDPHTAIVTDWYRAMKTTDGGKSWREIYSDRLPGGTYRSRGLDVTTSYGVHFDPFDSSHLAISYTDIGFHHSYDGGKSWRRSVKGVPPEWVNTCYWVIFDPEVRGKVWSGWSGMHDYPRGKMTRDPAWKQKAKGGICVSYDGGNTWEPHTEGIGADSPVTSLVLDPASPPGKRTLYAAVYSKGVFKSTDNGKTWQLKNKGIGDNTCAFELTMTGNGTLFLTVSPTPVHRNGKKGREFYPGAVYRSTDGAETWARLHVSEGMRFPNGIGADPRDPMRIYLACWSDIDLSDLVGGEVARTTGGNKKLPTPGGIFLSEDGGDTWRSIFDSTRYVYDVTVDPDFPGRVYCNTFNGAAYRSDDHGKTWNRIKGYDFHWGHRITTDKNNPGQIYINTYGSSVWHGFPVTADAEKPNPNGRNDAWGFVGFGGGGAMFYPTVSPHNPRRVLVGCDMTGSYATYDGGKSWRMFNLRGPAHDFVFDPSDSNTVYANTIALFKSTDRGTTWALFYPNPAEVSGIVSQGDHAGEIVVTRDSTLRKVIAFAVDPGDSQKLFAVISIDGKPSFCTSENGGGTWRTERQLEPGTKKIFIDPGSPPRDRTVLICGETGILKRQNGRWETRSGPGGVRVINGFSGGYDAQNKRFVIYAISGSSYFNPEKEKPGIFYTGDGGATWTSRQDGLLKQARNTDPEWRSIATSAMHPHVVYVSYANLKAHGDTTCIGVAKSEDYGKSWTLVWKDLLTRNGDIASPNFEKEWLTERFGPGWGENPFAIGVSPTNPEICYATDFGRTVKSEDGGQTWEQVFTRKKAGGGWVSRGLEVTTGYQLVFDPFHKKHVFIANTDIGLMESLDGGESWTSATRDNGVPKNWSNSTYWIAFDPEVKGRVWAAMSGTHDLPRPKMWRKNGVKGYTGGILVSENGGKTWRPVSGDIGEGAVVHLLVDPSSPPARRTLYACVFGKGVYKSTDGGATWMQKNKGIDGREPFAWRIVKREEDHTLFLVASRRSESGEIGTTGDGALYRSSDGGETWTKMALPPGTNGPTCLVVDPARRHRLLLSAWGRKAAGHFAPDTGGGIFVSEDDGGTWKPVLEQDQHIHDLTYDARVKRFYACGFNGSAYRSEDGGATWTRIRGYNFKWGKRVEPDPRDSEKIFIITFGGGVWYGPAKGDEAAVEDIVPVRGIP